MRNNPTPMSSCVITSRDRTFHDSACPSGDFIHLARLYTFSSSSKSVSCKAMRQRWEDSSGQR